MVGDGLVKSLHSTPHFCAVSVVPCLHQSCVIEHRAEPTTAAGKTNNWKFSSIRVEFVICWHVLVQRGEPFSEVLVRDLRSVGTVARLAIRQTDSVSREARYRTFGGGGCVFCQPDEGRECSCWHAEPDCGQSEQSRHVKHVPRVQKPKSKTTCTGFEYGLWYANTEKLLRCNDSAIPSQVAPAGSRKAGSYAKVFPAGAPYPHHSAHVAPSQNLGSLTTPGP